MKPDSGLPARQGAKTLFGNRHALTLVVFVVCVTVGAFMSVPVSSAGDIDWSLSVDINKRPSKLELSPVDRGNAYSIWAEVISGSYGVSVGFVTSLYDRRYDFGEVALMLEMAKVSGKQPSEVAVLRKKGLGWGVIAKRLGIHPSALKRAKGNESLFRRYVLANCLAGYYGVPDSKVLILLDEKGYGFAEIALAVNLCVHSGAPLGKIIRTREKSRKWRGVAEKFKVSPAKLGKLPTGLKEDRAKAKEKARAKEEAKAKAKKGAKDENPGKGTKGSGKKGAKKSCPKSCAKRCW